jgi:hypothetical protein
MTRPKNGLDDALALTESYLGSRKGSDPSTGILMWWADAVGAGHDGARTSPKVIDASGPASLSSSGGSATADRAKSG